VFPAQRSQAAQPSAERPKIVSLGAGVVLAMALSASAMAAEPSPLLIDPLDPRAEGEGPGLVGDPLLALLAVIALGLLAVGAAAIYAHLTRTR
jgi:hypothetical protein